MLDNYVRLELAHFLRIESEIQCDIAAFLAPLYVGMICITISWGLDCNLLYDKIRYYLSLNAKNSLCILCYIKH